MDGDGKPWDQITKRTSLEEHGFSLESIKSWREHEFREGRPSALMDFYRQHGLCGACNCTGVQMTGWDHEADIPLWQNCPICEGTGVRQADR